MANLSEKPPSRIVVVGGINMDIQGRSDAPFRPGDSNPGSSTMTPGGVGRNIAENLARLGVEVELLTVLGDDALSAELETSCAELGIGLSAALRLRGAAVSRYVCLLDADGSLVGAVASMESFARLLPEALVERAALLDSSALIVVDANIPEDSIAWLARRYGQRGRGGPALALDPVSVAKARRAAASIGAFAFAKPNRAEAAVLAEFAAPSGGAVPLGGSSPASGEVRGEVRGEGSPAAEGPAEPRPAAGRPGRAETAELRELAGRLRGAGLGELFVSLGHEGMYYEGFERRAGGGSEGGTRRGFVRLPRPLPEGLEPVNVSGAGDAACAALAWGYLRGEEPELRARYAIAAAMATAATIRTVSPEMGPDLIIELSKGVEHEPIS